MNTPAEINDRRFAMGWNRGFGTSHNLIGHPEFNNSGVGASLCQPQGIIQTTGGEFIGNSGIRMPVFKCPECSIIKNTSEELEASNFF